MVDNWEILRELQKTKNDKWADQIIDGLVDENLRKIKALLHLRGQLGDTSIGQDNLGYPLKGKKIMEKLMDIFDNRLTRWINIILWPIWVKGVTKNRRKE